MNGDRWPALPGVKVPDNQQPTLPGEYRWLSDTHGEAHAALQFMCPCGCGSLGSIRVTRDQAYSGEDHLWIWNLNPERPTLAPSIRRTAGCGFHGLLTGGDWKFYDDSPCGPRGYQRPASPE